MTKGSDDELRVNPQFMGLLADLQNVSADIADNERTATELVKENARLHTRADEILDELGEFLEPGQSVAFSNNGKLYQINKNKRYGTVNVKGPIVLILE